MVISASGRQLKSARSALSIELSAPRNSISDCSTLRKPYSVGVERAKKAAFDHQAVHFDEQHLVAM